MTVNTTGAATSNVKHAQNKWRSTGADEKVLLQEQVLAGAGELVGIDWKCCTCKGDTINSRCRWEMQISDKKVL